MRSSYSELAIRGADYDEVTRMLTLPLLEPELLWPPVPPLEPLPLPLPLLESMPRPVPHRRSAAALTMLMAGCGSRVTACDEDTRCRYPSKLCPNARVRKASGSLHRYCAHHRDKANANQKRWVDRQREAVAVSSPTSSSLSSSTSSCSSSSPPSPASSPRTGTKYRWIVPTSAAPFERPGRSRPSTSAAALSDDDWDALLALLAPSPAPIKMTAPVTPRCRRPRHRRHGSVAVL